MRPQRKCRKCQSVNTVDSTIELHHYDECGLPNVFLENVKATLCEDCGQRSIRIQGIEKLHRAIADWLIARPTKLTGSEIRYLREFLGWSNLEFARAMGVAPSTSSRWSSGNQDMSSTAERLLRLLVSNGSPAESYPSEYLLQLENSMVPSGEAYKLTRGPDSWLHSTPAGC